MANLWCKIYCLFLQTSLHLSLSAAFQPYDESDTVQSNIMHNVPKSKQVGILETQYYRLTTTSLRKQMLSANHLNVEYARQ